MKIILFSFVILFFEIPFLKAQAQTNSCVLEINSSFEHQNLKGHISSFAASQDLSPEQAYDSILYSKLTDHCTFNTSPGFFNKKYWILANLHNIGNNDIRLLLEVNNPHIDTLFVFSKSDTSLSFTKIGQGGDQMLFNERTLKNRRFIFPVNMSKQSQTTLILMIDKRTGATSFPMKIWKKDQFDKTESISNLIHAVYFGGLIFVSLFSLSIGLIIRNMRISLYGLYVLSMGLLMFTALGFSFEYFYPWSSTFNNYSRTFILVITLGLFTLFSMYFLNIRKYLKVAYWILIIISSYFFLLAISNFAFLDLVYNHIYFVLDSIYITMFLGILVLIYSLIRLFKIDRKNTLVYILAVLALILGGISTVLIEFGIFDENYFQYTDTLMIGSVVEIFIFSLSFVFEIKTIYEKKNQLLIEKSAQQKYLVEAYIKGTEEEGLRISKELHDNIGSRLAIIKSGLENYSKNLPKLKNELNTVFSDVKQISNKLSPNQLNILGFQDAVNALLLQLQEISSINVSFYSDDLPHIDHEVQLQLYRIIQEVIQNIIKHSEATEVDFQIIKEEGDSFVILIDDNGKGFNKKDISPKSLGLNNIQLRAEAINSRIEISSNINHGTHIVIWCDNYHPSKH